MPTERLPSPKILAFVICDAVIEDRGTNKKSLIGLFSRIRAEVFPCTHNIMHVFVSLTEGHGMYQSTLSCVKDDDESKKVLSVPGPVQFGSPLDFVEINFEIRGAVFPEAGIYRFDFLCDDIPVASRKFRVVERGGL